MTSSLAHRGPDDDGWLQRHDVILAHNRLSIIDLSACGHQPMPNETGTVWVCYNGEIYIYRALRAELKALGLHFASECDTEVLVHGFEEWGMDGLLSRLRGMFAFALYVAGTPENGGSGALYLARDRFGIKPLYFAAAPDGNGVLFASEARALIKSGLITSDEDPRGWLGYLLFGSVPSPWTTYRAIQTVPSGSYLEARVDGFTLKRYFDASDLFLRGEQSDASKPHASNGKSPVEAKEVFRRTLRSVLEETVRLHLLSDAPLGVFLSGGIDSSALVSLAALEKQELRTVGIVFDEAEYTEERYQRMVAERYHTDHRSIRITARDGRDGFDRFLGAMDQPTVDGLNTFFVARAAREAGLKAVLAGIGGDEIFAGYPTLDRAPTLSRLAALPRALRHRVITAAAKRPRWRKLEFLRQEGVLPAYLVQRGMFTPGEVARLSGADEAEVWRVIAELEPARAPRDPALRQQFMETRHYVADQLLRDGDVFGMAHSLEIRVPFLDHVLAETVLGSPFAWRRDKKWPKPLLSRTLEDLLPSEVIFRRKQGFTFPLDAWMREWGVGNHAPAGTAAERVWREFNERRIHWSRPWALRVFAERSAH